MQVVPVDNVTAEVGSDAVIESANNVTVSASLTQTVDSSASASLTGQDGNNGTTQSTSGGLAAALAIGVGYYSPTVKATIDSGAQVDAAGTIAVTATTDVPFEIPLTVNGVVGDIFYNPANPNYNPVNFLTGLFSDSMLGLGTDILNNTASAKVNTQDESRTALGGNIQVFVYNNNTTATIGAAKINQKVSDPNALGPGLGHRVPEPGAVGHRRSHDHVRKRGRGRRVRAQPQLDAIISKLHRSQGNIQPKAGASPFEHRHQGPERDRSFGIHRRPQ